MRFKKMHVAITLALDEMSGQLRPWDARELVKGI